MTDLLRVRDLTARFDTEDGRVHAVESVSFTVEDGESFGLVGESGSGKSATALSIAGLLPAAGTITGGSLWFRAPELAATTGKHEVDGEFVDLTTLPASARRSLRGTEIAMVFQDPMSSFDPSATVGTQIAKAVEVQQRASARPRSTRARTEGYGLGSLLRDSLLPTRSFVSESSRERAIELLERVGIPDPAKRAEQHPNEFSGGMLQRAMIAQAIAGEPRLLLADEPTTALDVTIQAQILSLLKEIQAETALSVVMITHDLGVVAHHSDRVGVMYAGELVERAPIDRLFDAPVHPYTQGLLGAVPDLDTTVTPPASLSGRMIGLHADELPEGCYFADRCPKAMTDCQEHPEERPVDETERHTARCVLTDRAFDPDDALGGGTAQQMERDHQ
ncbi:ABC transporter ATP-binding protein [Halocatena halophila]|uniref:ABC transporter ATP-binding protein n=1 Tax=Halocatena halophila TaxID=2814576 RepID=UPI002ED3F151